MKPWRCHLYATQSAISSVTVWMPCNHHQSIQPATRFERINLRPKKSELFADLWVLSGEPRSAWWEQAWQEAGVIDWRRWGHCLPERWYAAAVTGAYVCPLNLQSLLMGKIEESRMKLVMFKRDGRRGGDSWDSHSRMELKRRHLCLCLLLSTSFLLLREESYHFF